MTISAPRWDLTNVYPSLESKEFKNAIKKYKKMLDELEALFGKKLSKANSKTDPKKLEESLNLLAENLFREGNYAESELLYREVLASRQARNLQNGIEL